MTLSPAEINQQKNWIFMYKGKQYKVADSEVDIPLVLLEIITDSEFKAYRQIYHRLLRGKQTDRERALTVCRLWQFNDKDVKLVQWWSLQRRRKKI
jgi:hypothetical protein